jgi:hypothetical protein
MGKIAKAPTPAETFAAALAEPTVTIMHRDVILSNRRDKEPLSSVQRGDVALVDGRLIARAMCWTSAGPMAAYRFWDENENVARTPRLAALDWETLVNERLNSTAGAWGWHTLAPVEQSELDRFTIAWPSVANFLGVRPEQDRPKLFDVGPVQYPRFATKKPSEYGFPPDVLRNWVFNRHQAGDFGSIGEFGEIELTAPVAWTLWLQDQAVRNSAAIVSKAGGVISRFELGADLAANFPQPTELQASLGSRFAYFVEILTAFSARGSRSVLTVHVQQQERSNGTH